MLMGSTQNLIDPPLSEKDATAFHTFYGEFLKKDEGDALALLKSLALLRRSDLREYLHTLVLMRRRIEPLLPEVRKRDLFLSFPSTIQRVHQLLWEGQEAYGQDGATVMTILGSQIGDYLDQTEMFRIDLDSLLEDCPSMLPDSELDLAEAIAAGTGSFLFLLIALADHVFTVLLPSDHGQPTEALLKTREFLEKRLGAKFEEQIIEFFVLGGGYVRVAGRRLVLHGAHPLFDPTFSEFTRTGSERLLQGFVRGKYKLAIEAFEAAMPDNEIVVQG
jgi:hypothetical protein